MLIIGQIDLLPLRNGGNFFKTPFLAFVSIVLIPIEQALIVISMGFATLFNVSNVKVRQVGNWFDV